MYASLHINECLLVFYIHGIEHLNEGLRLMFEYACSGWEQAPEWFLARSEQRKGRGVVVAIDSRCRSRHISAGMTESERMPRNKNKS